MIILIVTITTLFIVGLNIKSNNKTTIENEGSEYQLLIQSLTPLSVSEFEEKELAEEDFLVFLGRESCPYCVEFLPVLIQNLKKNNLSIFYVDTEDTETNTDLKKLRSRLNINQVPTLIFIQKESSKIYDLNDNLDTFIKHYQSSTSSD